ncbi:IS5 family transposase [Streptomyces sp. NPDC018019]|uniref:IS5 family transposase n=1 Tax=Streptomyces sp. NPDC018019 TaxID=3365030 RepID=UPI00378BDB40
MLSAKACLTPRHPVPCCAPTAGGARLGAPAFARYVLLLQQPRRAYPSDLSAPRWALIESTLPAWRVERRSRAPAFARPPEYDLREIVNAILYVDRTGVQWRCLPHGFPPWETVYGYFAKWQKDGVLAQAHGVAAGIGAAAGGPAGGAVGLCDRRAERQDVHQHPRHEQGTDAGKKIVGRKRSLVTDTLGLLLAVLATAADVQDPAAGTQLLDQVAAAHPCLRKVWVDGGCRRHLVEHAASLGIDMENVARTPGIRGFTPIPKRWTVERTYGRLMFHRRLARDYETLPARSEAVIHLAMADLLARRLAARPPCPGANRPNTANRADRGETTG